MFMFWFIICSLLCCFTAQTCVVIVTCEPWSPGLCFLGQKHSISHNLGSFIPTCSLTPQYAITVSLIHHTFTIVLQSSQFSLISLTLVQVNGSNNCYRLIPDYSVIGHNFFQITSFTKSIISPNLFHLPLTGPALTPHWPHTALLTLHTKLATGVQLWSASVQTGLGLSTILSSQETAAAASWVVAGRVAYLLPPVGGTALTITMCGPVITMWPQWPYRRTGLT